VTYIVDFIIGIIGRICSSLISTYLIRLLDTMKKHKDNRHESK